VLDVLRTMFGDHQERDTVLSVVGQLVARNTDLERRVARLVGRFKPSEQVSTAQLVLFLDALKRRPEPPAPEDDVSKLRTPPPPRQPRSPTPPTHLRRVDHPIDVPAAQRTCPTCGGVRQCIEPHITEVIELLLPEVIVRRDVLPHPPHRSAVAPAVALGGAARRRRARLSPRACHKRSPRSSAAGIRPDSRIWSCAVFSSVERERRRRSVWRPAAGSRSVWRPGALAVGLAPRRARERRRGGGPGAALVTGGVGGALAVGCPARWRAPGWRACGPSRRSLGGA
jgi:hypothetical protein